MTILTGCFFGFVAWFLIRYLVAGLYTVNQNERAVKTVFGRAQRVEELTTLDDPISEMLNDDEKERYAYPQVRVIVPGGPYFKWPWERIHKVSIATETLNMAVDPDNPDANNSGTILEAVTKDQLNTGLTGQIRYRVSERNLYAYLFGVKKPIVHVMPTSSPCCASASRTSRRPASPTTPRKPPWSPAFPSTTSARTSAT